MLKFHISHGSWIAVGASRGAAVEGIEKVKVPRRYFRVLWPRGVVSLSTANEKKQKKKKKNRRDQYGSTGYTRNQLRLAANHPLPPSPSPSAALRPLSQTVETEGEIYGGCGTQIARGCEGCQATFRSLIDHRHGPRPSETIPPPSPPPPSPSPSPARHHHVARF